MDENERQVILTHLLCIIYNHRHHHNFMPAFPGLHRLHRFSVAQHPTTRVSLSSPVWSLVFLGQLSLLLTLSSVFSSPTSSFLMDLLIFLYPPPSSICILHLYQHCSLTYIWFQLFSSFSLHSSVPHPRTFIICPVNHNWFISYMSPALYAHAPLPCRTIRSALCSARRLINRSNGLLNVFYPVLILDAMFWDPPHPNADLSHLYNGSYQLLQNAQIKWIQGIYFTTDHCASTTRQSPQHVVVPSLKVLSYSMECSTKWNALLNDCREQSFLMHQLVALNFLVDSVSARGIKGPFAR